MKTYKYIVKGRVQGVGFRYFIYKNALSIGIKGTVKNRLDGAVEIIAQGDEDKILIFEGFINRGPSMSRVDKVIKEVIDSQPFKDFNIVG
ncbi:MAG TPA: acylphosphatase [Spirochaetota bacterium]|nr:acylphosphatase [Spirochaetota bacterium]HOM38485.1 acylphosphatase [Spirochaetota bacterium]HPQ49025.1 acylphosphatase [Spirochaetota bacterium]